MTVCANRCRTFVNCARGLIVWCRIVERTRQVVQSCGLYADTFASRTRVRVHCQVLDLWYARRIL